MVVQNPTNNVHVISNFYAKITKVALKLKGEGQISPKCVVHHNTYLQFAPSYGNF